MGPGWDRFFRSRIAGVLLGVGAAAVMFAIVRWLRQCHEEPKDSN